MQSNSAHWDTIFSATKDTRLGWYEKNTSKTFDLLNNRVEWNKSTVCIPGVGTSILIEELLSRGAQLILNDISEEAITRVKRRLGEKSNDIHWLCQNIGQPLHPALPQVDLWIDRAVLHFLTDEEERRGYFENLHSLVKSGGYVLFALFPPSGAPQCAGLSLHRYSLQDLSEKLGSAFSLISHFDYTYITPGGDPKPYIYALFQRGEK